MNLDVWDYDQRTGRAQLVTADLVLIEEFKALLDLERNKCREDPKGINHLRADREFTYIYLAIAWKSPYANFSNLERHEAALKDANISEKEWDDPIFRAACRKYQKLQDSNRYVRLLQSAQLVTDKIVDFFNNVDIEERDEQTGKYVNKVSDIQKAMKEATDQVETLKQLESLVKKEIMEQSQIRGGAIEGFMPDD